MGQATKHTPGPWTVLLTDEDPPRCDGIVEEASLYRKDFGYQNYIVETDSGVYPPTLPDAYLIAAAPDMGRELYRALAVIRNPQAFDIEGVAADIEQVLQKAGLL